MNSKRIQKIFSFVEKRNIAFLASVDKNGYPNIKAMLKPREIRNQKEFYFSTNTSSLRAAQYRENPKASVYFYRKGLIRYEGVMLIGTMEVLEDKEVKERLWRRGDKIFYRGGVEDPDYCVLRFTAEQGRYYCDLKTEAFSLKCN